MIKKYRDVYLNAIDRFLGKENITGIFIGYKFKDGKWTNKISLNVHVKEKIASQYLKRKEKVPKKLKGLQTDVIQSIPILTTAYRDRQNVINPGISIGPENASIYGTLGAFVYDSNNDLCILSCDHVMKAYETDQEINIRQPALIDCGLSTYDRIATYSQGYYGTNGDAAIAKVNSYRPHSRYVFNTTDYFTSIKLPSIDDIIIKTGRTTGETTGKVSSLGSFLVSRNNYSNQTISGFTIVPLTDPNEQIGLLGDSGACWYVESTGTILGIHTAQSASPTICYASFATSIFEELSISLTRYEKSWKIEDEVNPIGHIDLGWINQQTEKTVSIDFVPKSNLYNVFLFTKSDYIDSINGGILFAKRNSESTYRSIENYSNYPTCYLGDFTKDVPVKIDFKILTTNDLNLIGNYTIPIFIGHGEVFDSSGTFDFTSSIWGSNFWGEAS
ncbi:MAG: hypothetical protein ACFFCZ_20250 [Promethearchaeota archaeon]